MAFMCWGVCVHYDPYSFPLVQIESTRFELFLRSLLHSPTTGSVLCLSLCVSVVDFFPPTTSSSSSSIRSRSSTSPVCILSSLSILRLLLFALHSLTCLCFCSNTNLTHIFTSMTDGLLSLSLLYPCSFSWPPVTEDVISLSPSSSRPLGHRPGYCFE